MSLDLDNPTRLPHDMDHDDIHSSEESSSPISSSPEMESSATLPPEIEPSTSLPSPPSHHATTSRASSKLANSSIPRMTPSIYTRPNTTTSQPPHQPRAARTRLSPLTSSNANSCNPFPPLGVGALPKAQPLARALFAKMANGADVPHAGMGKKKGGNQKLIVPTKSFKTSFELKLTSSELARQ